MPTEGDLRASGGAHNILADSPKRLKEEILRLSELERVQTRVSLETQSELLMNRELY